MRACAQKDHVRTHRDASAERRLRRCCPQRLQESVCSQSFQRPLEPQTAYQQSGSICRPATDLLCCTLPKLSRKAVTCMSALSPASAVQKQKQKRKRRKAAGEGRTQAVQAAGEVALAALL